jgi:hypothetical protein
LEKMTPSNFEEKWSTYSTQGRPVLNIFNNQIQLKTGQH